MRPFETRETSASINIPPGPVSNAIASDRSVSRQLTARSITDAVRRFVMPLGRVDQLLATGDGARNPTLLRMIHGYLPEVEVLTAKAVGVDGDSLEVVAFMILGYQMLCGRQGNIPGVTGANAAAILGKLTLPPTPRG